MEIYVVCAKCGSLGTKIGEDAKGERFQCPKCGHVGHISKKGGK